MGAELLLDLGLGGVAHQALGAASDEAVMENGDLGVAHLDPVEARLLARAVSAGAAVWAATGPVTMLAPRPAEAARTVRRDVSVIGASLRVSL